MLPFKNGSPFPKLSTFPDGDLLPVACRLSGVSWQYQSQDGMKEARGRQTERTAGAGGQMHLWSRVFLPEQTLCRLFFFFFFLDKSLLGNECTHTGLWLSLPLVQRCPHSGRLRDELPRAPAHTQFLAPRAVSQCASGCAPSCKDTCGWPIPLLANNRPCYYRAARMWWVDTSEADTIMPK